MKEDFLAFVLAFEFPLHSQSAFNPSIFTIEKFAGGEKDKESLKKGLLAALVLNVLFSVGLYEINEIAGLVAFGVSLGIYLYFIYLINRR